MFILSMTISKNTSPLKDNRYATPVGTDHTINPYPISCKSKVTERVFVNLCSFNFSGFVSVCVISVLVSPDSERI